MSIERRWNRNEVSRESPEKEINRRPTSLKKFRADLSRGPRVSIATGWNIKSGGREEYLVSFLIEAVSAALPAEWDVECNYYYYYYYYYYYCHRCRGRTARLLESGSPTLHAVICLLIVLDAAIIVAQIFMDMHAVRSQYINSRLSLVHILSGNRPAVCNAINMVLNK